MATPKLDRIISEFSRRIAQPATFDGSGNLQDGRVMTAAEYVTYINRAMFKMIEDTWLQVKGDEKAFIRIFPELVKYDELVFTAGSGAAANNFKDFGYLVDGTMGDTKKYIRKLPLEQLSMALMGALPYNPTAATPAMTAMQNVIYIFPQNLFASGGSIGVVYIAMPLNPDTGAFLVQNGAIDSPFLDSHNTLIAEIAESLYRADSQSS